VGSIARRQMSDRELNLSVGTLPPIFNDWNETALRKLIDDLAGFATSRVNRQRKYLQLRGIGKAALAFGKFTCATTISICDKCQELERRSSAFR
jgi:hypothetical protein